MALNNIVNIEQPDSFLMFEYQSSQLLGSPLYQYIGVLIKNLAVKVHEQIHATRSIQKQGYFKTEKN